MHTKVKQVKGNIPLDDKLLNKYENVTELINKNMNIHKKSLVINSDIIELNTINIETMDSSRYYKLAALIFKTYNVAHSYFNDSNIIYISNSDIKESVNKIFHNINQRKYLIEHLIVFANLGNIVKHATLVAQNIEIKSIVSKKRDSNLFWSYYLDDLEIGNKIFLLEFDVVSRNDGENHYRLHRLKFRKFKNRYLG